MKDSKKDIPFSVICLRPEFMRLFEDTASLMTKGGVEVKSIRLKPIAFNPLDGNRLFTSRPYSIDAASTSEGRVEMSSDFMPKLDIMRWEGSAKSGSRNITFGSNRELNVFFEETLEFLKEYYVQMRSAMGLPINRDHFKSVIPTLWFDEFLLSMKRGDYTYSAIFESRNASSASGHKTNRMVLKTIRTNDENIPAVKVKLKDQIKLIGSLASDEEVAIVKKEITRVTTRATLR